MLTSSSPVKTVQTLRSNTVARLRTWSAPLVIFASQALLAASALAMPDNGSLPEPIRAPAGHSATLWTVGIGQITYVCKEKTDQPGQAGWVFGAPQAELFDAQKKLVGRYFGGPTWEIQGVDQTTYSVKGKQVAVSPAGEANIPLQLVQAAPQQNTGPLARVSYIQRLNTRGGIAPAAPCSMALIGQEQKVAYQADYVFYAVQ